MNPNQEIYPFNFYIPPISSLQNPTPNDFERLIERYQQNFFLYHKSTKTLPKSSNLENLYKNQFQRSNLHIITCGKGYHSSTHYNIHVLCLIYSLCSS